MMSALDRTQLLGETTCLEGEFSISVGVRSLRGGGGGLILQLFGWYILGHPNYMMSELDRIGLLLGETTCLESEFSISVGVRSLRGGGGVNFAVIWLVHIRTP